METKYDYDEELDILHIYNSEIDNGVKGGLSYGNFNIDLGFNNRVVGVELEGASSVLNLSQETLSNLDSVQLLSRRIGDTLFIGINVIKDKQNSTLQIGVPETDGEISVPMENLIGK